MLIENNILSFLRIIPEVDDMEGKMEKISETLPEI
jgi:hypothetical protein